MKFQAALSVVMALVSASAVAQNATFDGALNTTQPAASINGGLVQNATASLNLAAEVPKEQATLNAIAAPVKAMDAPATVNESMTMPMLPANATLLVNSTLLPLANETVQLTNNTLSQPFNQTFFGNSTHVGNSTVPFQPINGNETTVNMPVDGKSGTEPSPSVSVPFAEPTPSLSLSIIVIATPTSSSMPSKVTPTPMPVEIADTEEPVAVPTRKEEPAPLRPVAPPSRPASPAPVPQSSPIVKSEANAATPIPVVPVTQASPVVANQNATATPAASPRPSVSPAVPDADKKNDNPSQIKIDAPVVIAKERLPQSTAEGRQLLSVLPNEPTFDRDAAKSLPSGAPVIALAFNNNVCSESDICSNPSGPARKQFESQLKMDVANALNTDDATKGKMRPDNVVVLSIAEVNSRIAAQFSILPPDAQTDMAAVVTALKEQTQDPESPLLSRGLVTKNIDGNSFGVDVVEPLRNDGLTNVSGMDTATIVGISVGACVGFVLLFVGAHRVYVRRQRQQPSSSAPSHDSVTGLPVPLLFLDDPSETFTLPRGSIIFKEIDTTRDSVMDQSPAVEHIVPSLSEAELPRVDDDSDDVHQAEKYNTLMVDNMDRDTFLSAENLSLPRDSMLSRPVTTVRRPSDAATKILSFDIELDQ